MHKEAVETQEAEGEQVVTTDSDWVRVGNA